MQPDFEEIFERFDDDENAIRYIHQLGIVKGIFAGAIIASIICWVLS